MKNPAIVNDLNALLADSIVFAQKLHHYHWRVRGEGFFQLHARFEELYDRFGDVADELAERILMVGGAPLAGLRQALDLSRIDEDESVPAARDMVIAVRADMEHFHGAFRAASDKADKAGDKGSVGMLDPLADALEKEMWMIDAWLDA